MKTKFTLISGLTLLMFLLLGQSVISFAQENQDTTVAKGNKYGATPEIQEECKINLSLYREFVKQKNYVDAINGWRKVFEICPQSTKAIYSDGVKIYKSFIKNEADQTRKEELVDTLIMIYDMRIEFFGDDPKYSKGYILGRKAADVMKYKKLYEEAFKMFEESYELQGEKSEAAILSKFMNVSTFLLKKGIVTDEKVVSIYVNSTNVIDAQIKAIDTKVNAIDVQIQTAESDDAKKDLEAKKAKVDRKIEKLKQVQGNLDKYFTDCPASTCDKLIPVFKPKFEATPDNISLLKNIVKILSKKDCKADQLYFDAVAKLHELEPSTLSAYSLGDMSEDKGLYSKAADYYKQAIELSESNKDKSVYYLKLAAVTSGKLGNPQQARSYAYKAIENNSEWGKPYMLIANIYASTKGCGEDELAKKSIYWAAVDKLIKAKNIDPKVAADANAMISNLKKHFPNEEVIFFNGLKVGDTYTVPCWINEITKVRSR
jgi:tetratricopeptide (TPR) repeat protein